MWGFKLKSHCAVAAHDAVEIMITGLAGAVVVVVISRTPRKYPGDILPSQHHIGDLYHAILDDVSLLI